MHRTPPGTVEETCPLPGPDHHRAGGASTPVSAAQGRSTWAVTTSLRCVPARSTRQPRPAGAPQGTGTASGSSGGAREGEHVAAGDGVRRGDQRRGHVDVECGDRGQGPPGHRAAALDGTLEAGSSRTRRWCRRRTGSTPVLLEPLRARGRATVREDLHVAHPHRRAAAAAPAPGGGDRPIPNRVDALRIHCRTTTSPDAVTRAWTRAFRGARSTGAAGTASGPRAPGPTGSSPRGRRTPPAPPPPGRARRRRR